MPVVRISDEVFERLQVVAIPLVDTPGSVIEKLLDFYESHQTNTAGLARKEATSETSLPKRSAQFDPDSPPDVQHTRIAATFDSERASHWNELLHLAHRRGVDRLGSVDTLRTVTKSNMVAGRRTGKGFHYVPDANISIQNVDANVAWRHVLHLARQLKVPVQVDFEWRNVEGAAKPGQRGSLSWSPRDNKRADA